MEAATNTFTKSGRLCGALDIIIGTASEKRISGLIPDMSLNLSAERSSPEPSINLVLSEYLIYDANLKAPSAVECKLWTINKNY